MSLIQKVLCFGICYIPLILLFLFMARKTVDLIVRRKEETGNLVIVFFAFLVFLMTVICVLTAIYSLGINRIVDLLRIQFYFFLMAIFFVQLIFSLFILIFRVADTFYLFRYGMRQIFPGVFLDAILSYAMATVILF